MTMVANVEVTDGNAYRRGILTAKGGDKHISTNVLFDTGSVHNLIPISHSIILQTEMYPLSRPMHLSGAFDKDKGNATIKCTHYITLDIEFDLKDGGNVTLHEVKFIVVPEKCQFAVILGINTMKNRKILTGYRLGIMHEDQLRVFALTAQVEITPQGQNKTTGNNIYWIDHPYGTEAVLAPGGNDEALYRISGRTLELPPDLNVHGRDALIMQRENKWGDLRGIEIVQNTENILKITHNTEGEDIDYSKVNISPNLSKYQKEQVQAVIKEYGSIFSKGGYDIGDCDSMFYRVDTTTDRPQPARPINLPHEARTVVHLEIKKLVQAGILEQDNDVRVITSSFIPIKKPGGRGWRIVNDLRSANAVVLADNYQLPRIDDLLAKMTNHKFYCTVDCTKGFYSLRLLKSQRKLFTCADPVTGLTYSYLKLPMGSKNSPQHFQKAVFELLLRNLPPRYVSAYIDDITIYHDSFEKLIELLKQLFSNFKAANFKINLLKCSFFYSEVVVFGFRVGVNGTGITHEKSAAFADIKRPETGKSLSQTLGKFGYYRGTIIGYSNLTAPLIRLQKDKKIDWNQENIQAWDNLINGLRKAVDLAKPDFTQLFILETDASSVAIGAVLKQEQTINGKIVPKIIGVFSAKLSRTELSWECSNRELLAVYRSVCHFRSYLYGRRFRIRSDSRVVVLLLSAKMAQVEIFGAISPSYRYLRYLSEFDFEIVHTSGALKSFLLCDLLSRLNLDQEVQRTFVMGRNNRDALCYFKNLKSGKLDKVVDHQVVQVNQITQNDIPIGAEEARGQVRLAQAEENWKEHTKDLISREKSEYKIDKEGNVVDQHGFLIVRPGSEHELLPELHIHGEGVPGLIQRLSEYRLTMKGKYRIINKFIKGCDTCAMSSKLREPKFKDKTMYKLTDIGQLVSLDVFHIGNIKVLLMLDLYSKYASFTIVPNESGAALRDGICDLILRYGVVKAIKTDNAAGFTSMTVKLLCQLFNITHTTSIPRNSRGQGSVENLVNYYQSYLRALRGPEENKDITVMLSIITLKWNTSPKKTLTGYSGTRYSPFEVVFGRNCRLLSQAPTFDAEKLDSLPNKLRKVYYELKEIQKQLEEQANSRLTKMEKDTTREENTRFTISDIVKIKSYRRPGEPKKFFRPWSNSNFRVVEILDFANSLLLEKCENHRNVRPNRIRCHMRQAKLVRRKAKEDNEGSPKPTFSPRPIEDKTEEVAIHLDEPRYALRKRAPVDYRE